MIRVVNLKNYVERNGEILFKIDRTSPVGNPFFLKSEKERDEVCDKYEEYFYKKIKEEEGNFRNYIILIYKISLKKDIALGCHCFPKRCHGDVIKSFLEREI